MLAEQAVGSTERVWCRAPPHTSVPWPWSQGSPPPQPCPQCSRTTGVLAGPTTGRGPTLRPPWTPSAPPVTWPHCPHHHRSDGLCFLVPRLAAHSAALDPVPSGVPWRLPGTSGGCSGITCQVSDQGANCLWPAGPRPPARPRPGRAAPRDSRPWPADPGQPGDAARGPRGDSSWQNLGTAREWGDIRQRECCAPCGNLTKQEAKATHTQVASCCGAKRACEEGEEPRFRWSPASGRDLREPESRQSSGPFSALFHFAKASDGKHLCEFSCGPFPRFSAARKCLSPC